MDEFQDTPRDDFTENQGEGSSETSPDPQSALAAMQGNEYLSPSSQPTQSTTNIFFGYPIGIGGRVLLILWSLFLCAGFTLASQLTPDSRGYGTHQSLGFPPCTFQVLFDIPCPSCGMTTSFAHFMRGELVSSARANVAGLMLAISCFFLVPWCWISAVSGRLWRVRDPVNSALILVGSLSALALINWIRLIW